MSALSDVRATTRWALLTLAVRLLAGTFTEGLVVAAGIVALAGLISSLFELLVQLLSHNKLLKISSPPMPYRDKKVSFEMVVRIILGGR